MGLDGLSLKELVLLGRRAERECARCFRALAERVAPRDPPLVRALHDHAAEEEEHEATLAGFDGRLDFPRVWHLDEAMIDRLLRRHLPCLCSAPGREPLDRASAMDRARELEEEAIGFYRALSRQAPDEASRTFFLSLADWEAAHRSLLPRT